MKVEINCIVLYCICIALHCIALHCIALHCIVETGRERSKIRTAPSINRKRESLHTPSRSRFGRDQHKQQRARLRVRSVTAVNRVVDRCAGRLFDVRRT